MNRWCFDIEVYKDLFCVTFANVESKDVKVFRVFDNVNESEELFEFLDDDKQLVGYNNIDYDNPVMQFLVQNRDWCTTRDVFEFSSNLISLERGQTSKEIKEYKFTKTKYSQIDLMKLIEVNGNVPSLKMVGIILHWHKVQDLPYPFDYRIKNWTEAEEIISYNLNDVLISDRLYEKLLPEIELREKLSAMYGLNLLSFSDSKIGDKLLEKFYCEKTGETDVWKLRDKVTNYEKFYVKECLFDDIYFQTNYMKRMLREVGDTLVRTENNFAFTKSVTIGGVEYKFATGGLHSVDTPAKFVTNEDFVIRDVDFSSYYPSMMIKNKIFPNHISPLFIDILKEITEERIKAKKTDKVKAAGLKITINAIFGKLGFIGSWFRDSKAFLSVTVPGQLYLLMLIERFVLAGIQVISANTDGIVCRIPRKLEDTYYEIANNFSKEIGIGVEFTDYDVYYRRDVNNYLSKKHDDVKTKGVYTPKAEIKKGYKYPVVPKAVYQYIVNDIPVEETIYNHKNILDFCASQKMGGEFVAQYHKDDGEIEELQKTNRFYISKSGGRLIKKSKKNGKEIGLYVGKNLRILNDFNENDPFENYDIDYGYYLEECHALIDDVRLFEEEFIPFVDEDENYCPPQEDKEKSELAYELREVKGFPDKALDNLVVINRDFIGKDFLDLLVYAENSSFLASKWEDIIKLNYFSKFGQNKRLLLMWQEFRKGKNKYTSKLSEKSKKSRLIELRKYWESLEDKPLSVTEQIEAELSITGRIKSTFPTLDKRYAYVVESKEGKNSFRVTLQGLASGKRTDMYIRKKLLAEKDLSESSIICVTNHSKNTYNEKEYRWIDSFSNVTSKELNK
jgi:hypothetical protein